VLRRCGAVSSANRSRCLASIVKPMPRGPNREPRAHDLLSRPSSEASARELSACPSSRCHPKLFSRYGGGPALRRRAAPKSFHAPAKGAHHGRQTRRTPVRRGPGCKHVREKGLDLQRETRRREARVSSEVSSHGRAHTFPPATCPRGRLALSVGCCSGATLTTQPA
jgi:hypothetical protein